ncbi:hypothetical protein [Acidocella facilis]|uniref:hypothetical protein n=1 Tax=Acidocella facilis TaxID=525 RepID=UPI001F1CA1A3|nr:hypothetical protein [Acidocella facilis]
MSIPAISDPKWRSALTGAEPKVNSLATKLLLSRLREEVRHNPSGIGRAAVELHEFFANNAFAARDLVNL